MKKLVFRLTGQSPLLMHNCRLANPLDPVKREIGKYTSKRKKTDADFEEISRLEFIGGLYLNSDGPCMPAPNLKRMLVEGAKRDKLGKHFTTHLFVEGDAAIEYDGPREPEAMWKAGTFHWSTMVGNQNNKVLRTRPRFDDWELTFAAEFDPDNTDTDQVLRAVEMCERLGLGDGRAIGFGRFTSQLLD